MWLWLVPLDAEMTMALKMDSIHSTQLKESLRNDEVNICNIRCYWPIRDVLVLVYMCTNPMLWHYVVSVFCWLISCLSLSQVDHCKFVHTLIYWCWNFFTTKYQYGHWPQKSSIFQAHIFITALCFIVSCGDAYAALNISVDTPFTSWIIAL